MGGGKSWEVGSLGGWAVLGGGLSWGMGCLGGWAVLGDGMSYSSVSLSETVFGSALITTALQPWQGGLASQVTGGVCNLPWPLLTSTTHVLAKL